MDIIKEEIIKKFNQMIEGLPAFQQMPINEGGPNNGRDSEPIENKDETRKIIKKEVISTMASKERINDKSDPIECEKQTGDKNSKKNENAGIGSFSTPTQSSSELINQVGHEERVDAVEEINKRTDVKNNSESIFKGLDPNIEEDLFYKSIDELIEEDTQQIQKSHLIGSEQNAPLGSKNLAEKLELNLYSSLRKTINNWYDNIEKNTDPDDALVSLKKDIIKWQNNISKDTLEGMSNLLDKGIQAGIRKTKVPVDKKFYGKVNYTSLSKNGIIPAIHNLSDEVFKKTSTAFRKHYINNENKLYSQKRDIDSNLRELRPKTKLMLKTEMARFGNLGALTAFNEDPNRNFYKYSWDNVGDNRSKKISLIRKQESPYSFSEISFLLKNQEQLIDNSWMADQFNQRCSFSRGEILEKEWLDNRFMGREDQFKETL